MHYQSRNIAELFLEWIIQFHEKKQPSSILQHEVGLGVMHCICSYSIILKKSALNHSIY